MLITLILRLCEFTSATMHFCVADDASSSQTLSWFLPVINTISLNTFRKEKDSNTLLECKFDTPLPCITDLFLREEALDRDATCEYIRRGRKLLPNHIAMMADFVCSTHQLGTNLKVKFSTLFCTFDQHISQTPCNLIAIRYKSQLPGRADLYQNKIMLPLRNPPYLHDLLHEFCT
jgi:hypothetical protein